MAMGTLNHITPVLFQRGRWKGEPNARADHEEVQCRRLQSSGSTLLGATCQSLLGHGLGNSTSSAIFIIHICFAATIFATSDSSLQVTSSQILREKDIQPSKLSFGFLGLGIMGSGIVKNLLNSGHTVTVWNRTVEKVRNIFMSSFPAFCQLTHSRCETL